LSSRLWALIVTAFPLYYIGRRSFCLKQERAPLVAELLELKRKAGIHIRSTRRGTSWSWRELSAMDQQPFDTNLRRAQRASVTLVLEISSPAMCCERYDIRTISSLVRAIRSLVRMCNSFACAFARLFVYSRMHSFVYTYDLLYNYGQCDGSSFGSSPWSRYKECRTHEQANEPPVLLVWGSMVWRPTM
jgi:hypothetical protein